MVGKISGLEGGGINLDDPGSIPGSAAFLFSTVSRRTLRLAELPIRWVVGKVSTQG
jgi:hypothetical protein